MKKRKQESRVVRYEERQTINSCLYEHKSQDRGKKKELQISESLPRLAIKNSGY